MDGVLLYKCKWIRYFIIRLPCTLAGLHPKIALNVHKWLRLYKPERMHKTERDQSVSQIVDNKRINVKIERNFLYPGLDLKKNIGKKIYTQNSEYHVFKGKPSWQRWCHEG